jgi:arginine decarboxylase
LHTSSPHTFKSAPNAIWASAGAAEGDTELNAFDNALLAAQVGNLNLIRVSSVLPQDAQLLEAAPRITPGSLVPTVYSVHVSAQPGETIAAAIGIGVGDGSHGMIFEYKVERIGCAVAAVVLWWR